MTISTIPNEKLLAVRTIISHANCADGLASGILLRDALPDATLRFVQYGTQDHLEMVAEPGMLFCDFSPHPDRVADFVAAGVIVLDHHRTARGIVEACAGIYGDETAEPGVSGAVLALRHVWRPLRESTASELASFAEHFARVAGIRDTWQTKSPLWGEACEQTHVLTTFPRAWWLGRTLAAIAASWESELAPLGAVLRAKEEERVRRAIDGGYRFTTGKGLRVLAVQGVSVTSDGAELLGDTVDLVVGFSYAVENGAPKVRFSLRSHTGVDCAALAKAHSGGGHTAAAGFALKVTADAAQPYRVIEELLAGV